MFLLIIIIKCYFVWTLFPELKLLVKRNNKKDNYFQHSLQKSETENKNKTTTFKHKLNESKKKTKHSLNGSSQAIPDKHTGIEGEMAENNHRIRRNKISEVKTSIMGINYQFSVQQRGLQKANRDLW